MKLIKFGALISAIGVCGIPAAHALSSKYPNFYVGADVAALEGTVEGSKTFINKETDTTFYGGTVGFQFNRNVSIDAFYHESDEYEIKNYGIRLNARPMLWGPIYGVGSIGLVQSKYVAKGLPVAQDPFDTNKDDVEEIKTSDKTEIAPAYALGLGYRYQNVDFEVKYSKMDEFDGVMGSLMVRF